jgi:hypothetical protein
MTRLFTDGAESGDLLRWSSVVGGEIAITSINKRTGTYSYFMRSDGAHYLQKNIPGSITEFYARFAVYHIVNSVFPIFGWYTGGSNGGSLRTNTFGIGIGSLTMYDGANWRVTSSLINLSLNEWHVYEVHVKIDAAPNGIFQLKYDGTTIIDWTGATDAQASLDNFRFMMLNPGYQLTQYHLDDIAFNDTAGGVDDSWANDGGVLAALVPEGVGAYTDLVAQGAVNAWDCVNDIPPNSSDYVYSSVIDEKSVYAMTAVAGLPVGASIARIWVELDALETAADGDEIATLLRSNVTDDQGSDQALTIAYVRYLSPEYLEDPDDPGVAWSEAKVNALQAGGVVR